MKISVVTSDKYLKTEAELLLGGSAELSFSADEDADITLVDIDTTAQYKASGRVIRLSRVAGLGDRMLPLPFDFFTSLLKGNGEARLTLDGGNRTCTVDTHTVKLTAHEYKLLALIYSRGGEYVSRSEISESVFDGGNDNLINIYIHYLREKLELGSNKIILSSRKFGYAINKDFLGGKIC